MIFKKKKTHTKEYDDDVICFSNEDIDEMLSMCAQPRE